MEGFVIFALPETAF